MSDLGRKGFSAKDLESAGDGQPKTVLVDKFTAVVRGVLSIVDTDRGEIKLFGANFFSADPEVSVTGEMTTVCVGCGLFTVEIIVTAAEWLGCESSCFSVLKYVPVVSSWASRADDGTLDAPANAAPAGPRPRPGDVTWGPDRLRDLILGVPFGIMKTSCLLVPASVLFSGCGSVVLEVVVNSVGMGLGSTGSGTSSAGLVCAGIMSDDA